MCRQQDAIDAVSRAADELAEACRSMCPDLIGTTLQSVYNRVLIEGVKPSEQELLDRLQ